MADWSKEVLTHIKKHIHYPADGMEIITVCQNAIDISDGEEHKNFERKISKHRVYCSPKDILEDINS